MTITVYNFPDNFKPKPPGSGKGHHGHRRRRGRPTRSGNIRRRALHRNIKPQPLPISAHEEARPEQLPLLPTPQETPIIPGGGYHGPPANPIHT